MKGLIFGGDRTVEYVEVEDPTPEAGEVVLEMKASGICGSDLHMYRGPKGMRLLGVTATGPIIAGHEPCGVVVAVGPGVAERQAKIGDRVMVHHDRAVVSARIAVPAGHKCAIDNSLSSTV